MTKAAAAADLVADVYAAGNAHTILAALRMSKWLAFAGIGATLAIRTALTDTRLPSLLCARRLVQHAGINQSRHILSRILQVLGKHRVIVLP